MTAVEDYNDAMREIRELRDERDRLRTALKAAADAVERAAFNMKPPNAHTPVFAMIAIGMRGIVHEQIATPHRGRLITMGDPTEDPTQAWEYWHERAHKAECELFAFRDARIRVEDLLKKEAENFLLWNAMEKAHCLAQSSRRAMRDHGDKFLDLNACAHEFQAAYDAVRDVNEHRDLGSSASELIATPREGG